MSRYCESKARTNRLRCSDCNSKIQKGDQVIFEVEDGEMENAYCEGCGANYAQQVIEDNEHPFSLDALGQD